MCCIFFDDDLLILKTISRVQIEDVYDNIKKSPETEKLFHEFFDKHGMIRGGFYFDQLTKLVNRVYGEVVTAQYSNINDNFRETDFCELVKTAIDDNIPIILGMDFKTGGGHAVLALGTNMMKMVYSMCFVLIPDMNVTQHHIGIWLLP